jgi:hypothetical protein
VPIANDVCPRGKYGGSGRQRRHKKQERLDNVKLEEVDDFVWQVPSIPSTAEEKGNAEFGVYENIPSELKQLLSGKVFLLNEWI